MIYFVSDTHWSHSSILKYCPSTRGHFQSIEEHDERLISNWNKTVTNKDTVYHLGDFGFGSFEYLEKVFNRLNGEKILVKGNHDSHSLKLGWKSIHEVLEIKYNKQYYVLCHFPMRSWNRMHYNSRHLYGHCHGNLNGIGYSCDVGVDCWNLKPVSIETIEKHFKSVVDNEIMSL